MYIRAQKTIDATPSVEIVSWSQGTDEQIAAMVQAADEGLIDLTEYWSVGDERVIHLSAMSATGVGESHVEQDVTLVLMQNDLKTENKDNPCWNYQYVDQTKVRKWPSFIVQQKNCLANGTSGETGYMNSSDTNSGSWNGCARRTWCNNIYKAAIPATLLPIFKEVGVKTISVYNGSTIQTSNDYFFLPAAREVFVSGVNDTYAYGNETEWNNLSCWEYYKTTSNRIKKRGDSGSASVWWERSPRRSSGSSFCFVGSSGNDGYANASYSYLIAPAGCI